MLNSKYEKILPTNTYLSDSVILAQAWKKSQQYIRSTNWYADNFELDISTINLEDNLHSWTKNLTESNIYLDPLQLVPAPKASHWIFDNAKWVPEDPQTLQMRPLAHIKIKDQTYFTALLICIANTVETKQGNTECPLSDVHENHIVNYGNRLYCSYNDTQAKFLWGNSKIYREYFNDYQTFLQRPIYFAKQAYLTKSKDEEIFIIHLDVSRFYDTIDREKLINKIKEHIYIYKNDNSETSYLDNLLRSFQEWAWTHKSKMLYNKTCQKNKESIPKGIPQGLVAGGFLANIYLLEFDEELSYEIGKPQDSYQILDYCRYVDDMRVVISAKTTLDMITLKSKIIAYISSKLKCINLQLNDDKTEIQKYTPKINNISNSINKIKNAISGPMSQNEVDDNINQLESILTLTSTKNNDSDKNQTTNPLELIETSNHDIREDTLLRFSANNLHKLLKHKRSFYAQQVDQNNNIVAGDWDFLQERIARRFISCWSKDPSLVVLLKKGLELFPDIKLLEPIIQELLTDEQISEKQKYIYEYCLCEIFRHSATILHNKSIWAFPAHAQIDTFFEYLQTIATNIINSDTKNEYLKHQVMFYMLTKNNSIPTSKAKKDRKTQHILKIIAGDCNHNLTMTETEFLENVLLAYKFTLKPKVTIRTINLLIENYYAKQILINELTEILKKLAIQSPELFTLIIKHAKSLKLKWLSLNGVQILIDQMLIYDQPIKGTLEPNHDLPFFSILKRSDNPFAHENAILKLLRVILKQYSFNEQLDVSKMKIQCTNWTEAQDFKTEFIISYPLTADKDPIYKAPSWLTNEHKALYNIGIFIRTCLLGKLDWSTSNSLYNKNSENLSLKTSYYKRQLGMMHSPESICGQNAALSSWLSELLYYLLQWPGISLSNNQFKSISNVNHLLKSIEQRCIYQENMYCELSRIPGYVETIDLKWDKLKRSLSVIMVQSLLPRKNDFTSHGITLSTPSYRAKHRQHIAAVSELILKTIICQNSDNSSQQNQIDLIVWPELSVHIDDTDILKRLSDKTGAIIFAGLNFITQTNIPGPNNVAKWIIPNKFHGNRTFIERLQGKCHITQDEQQGGIMSWRPYQLFIELKHPSFPNHSGFMLTGSICYDATDIKLSADLKMKSNAYIVSALNQDTATFDTMIDALHYHMYQQVVLVNGGEFGGSVAKAPYKERYDKLITHTHGKNQINISRFEMNMFDFRNITNNFHSGKKSKTKPAGA